MQSLQLSQADMETATPRCYSEQPHGLGGYWYTTLVHWTTGLVPKAAEILGVRRSIRPSPRGRQHPPKWWILNNLLGTLRFSLPVATVDCYTSGHENHGEVPGTDAIFRRRMSASGYKRTLWGRASNVRFTPESGHYRRKIASVPESGHLVSA